jgi:hypothetical protein
VTGRWRIGLNSSRYPFARSGQAQTGAMGGEVAELVVQLDLIAEHLRRQDAGTAQQAIAGLRDSWVPDLIVGILVNVATSAPSLAA